MQGPRRQTLALSIGDDPLQPIAAYVVHWHASDWCQETVATLHASIGVTVDVTVINNGGRLDLGCTVQVQEMPCNVGFAAAANVALSYFRERDLPFCFIGCHDIQLAEGALAEMARALERSPTLGVVGPAFDDSDISSDLVDLEWISGSGLLIRRAVAENISFDETYGSYVEDVDFCFRVRDRGWTVARVPNAKATTHGSIDARAAYVLMHGNTLLFFLRRRHFRAFAGRCRLLLRDAVAGVVSRDFRSSARAMGACWHFLRQAALLRRQALRGRRPRYSRPRSVSGSARRPES